jgi:hypothetical protein
MFSILVTSETFPVAVDEVVRHGEERGGFVQPERTVRIRGVVTAR